MVDSITNGIIDGIVDGIADADGEETRLKGKGGRQLSAGLIFMANRTAAHFHFLIVDFFFDQGPRTFSHRNYGRRTNESPIMATSQHRPGCAPCRDVAIIGDSYVLKLQSYCRGVKAY